MQRKHQLLYLVIIFLVLIPALLFAKSQKNRLPQILSIKIQPTAIPTPTPFVFKTYTAPTIPVKPYYKIVMIGDSMTAALGPHGGGLSEYMNTLFKRTAQNPGQRIVIDNYAKSSNIQAVNNELDDKITIGEYTFGPLLSDTFDMILVESYGYNPLSQFGVDEGLRQQDLALTKLMETLITTHPNAIVVFVATISPNKVNYAKATQPNYSPSDRARLAEERISYIKNHIQYAVSHNIPIINIYQDSLTTNGDGNMKYINPTDDIHPSFAGIDFINHEIGDFIYNNKLFLQ